MLRSVVYDSPRPVESLSYVELGAKLERVASNDLAGFVIANSSSAFSDAVRAARELGFVGDTKQATTFRKPTQFHADGEEGDEMLSISEALVGEYEIRIFKRAPEIVSVEPIHLWDVLDSENTNVLARSQVDTAKLGHRATLLRAQAGNTVIFNPSNPHIGVPLTVPRHSESTFFRR